MEMAQNDDGAGNGGGTYPPSRKAGLRPPWKKGQSGNPRGPKPLTDLERLCRKVFKGSLKAAAPPAPEVKFDAGEDIPFEAPSTPEVLPVQLHPIVHAAVVREAARYSGLMTGAQKVGALEKAAKMRSMFASEREWLLFVQACAGHDVDEIMRQMPATEEHGDAGTSGIAAIDDGGAGDGERAPGGGDEDRGERRRSGDVDEEPERPGSGEGGPGADRSARGEGPGGGGDDEP